MTRGTATPTQRPGHRVPLGLSCPSVPQLRRGLGEPGGRTSPSLCVRPSQCGRHQGILRLVCSFIERTFTATPFHARVAAELGHLFVLQDQVKEASVWYSEAMNLDENSVAALTGLRRLGRAAGGSVRVGNQVGSPPWVRKRGV